MDNNKGMDIESIKELIEDPEFMDNLIDILNLKQEKNMSLNIVVDENEIL